MTCQTYINTNIIYTDKMSAGSAVRRQPCDIATAATGQPNSTVTTAEQQHSNSKTTALQQQNRTANNYKADAILILNGLSENALCWDKLDTQI